MILDDFSVLCKTYRRTIILPRLCPAIETARVLGLAAHASWPDTPHAKSLSEHQRENLELVKRRPITALQPPLRIRMRESWCM